MAKKTQDTNLKLVDPPIDEERKKKWSEEYDRWETAEKEMRITAREARRRVSLLRTELEAYRSQLEALPFDIPAGDLSMPICLDQSDRKYTLELVEDLDSRI